MNDVCDQYDALLERISYMEACFVDRSTVIFETIQLSSETIDGLFSGEKHPMYFFLCISYIDCRKYMILSVVWLSFHLMDLQ